jgi:hypothetical protein
MQLLFYIVKRSINDCNNNNNHHLTIDQSATSHTHCSVKREVKAVVDHCTDMHLFVFSSALCARKSHHLTIRTFFTAV